MCLIVWSKKSFILPTIMTVFRGHASGSFKECLNCATPHSRPFVEQKSCTGAAIDLQHARIHCCYFHSSLQNTMKFTIESRGAAFSSACFLERAELSFCCWSQADKKQVSAAWRSKMLRFLTARIQRSLSVFFIFVSSALCGLLNLKVHFFGWSTHQILLTCLKCWADALRHK